MNCEQVREQLLDLAAAPTERFPAAHQHLDACAECARRLKELRQTMTLLDEWKAPEPSPFFSARLQARLREEAERPQTWLERLRQATEVLVLPARKTATALALVLLVAAGLLLLQSGREPRLTPGPQVTAARGTAVGDLQTLNKDQELYADFDLDGAAGAGNATP